MMRHGHGIRHIPRAGRAVAVRSPICAARVATDCSIVLQPISARHTKIPGTWPAGRGFLRLAGFFALIVHAIDAKDTGSLEWPSGHGFRLMLTRCAESARREVMWGNG